MAYRHMRRSAFSAGTSDSRNRLESGGIRGNMLTQRFAFHHIGRMAKNFRADLDFQKQKSAIHVARLTIHEVDVRNRPYFSDKLVEDWRWQKR